MTLLEDLRSLPFRRPRVGFRASIGASLALAVAHVLAPSCFWYHWALSLFISLGAAALANWDLRTHRLPNQQVLALCCGFVIQVACLAVGSPLIFTFQAVAAALVVLTAYLILGTLGFVGFGDAKFAAALALGVGVISGLMAILIVPVALCLTSASRLLWRKQRGFRVHGPSLAAGAILVATVASIAQ